MGIAFLQLTRLKQIVCTLYHRIFTGILVSIIGNSLDKDMYKSFTEMNKALKQRVEKMAI